MNFSQAEYKTLGEAEIYGQTDYKTLVLSIK